jgi:hypothetical protein
MTPASAIASLDKQIAEHGETCVLRRKEGNPLVTKDCTIRASVRDLTAQELVGTGMQAASEVIMSMTQVLAAGWPSGHVVTAGTVDPRVPRANDFMVIKGKQRQVKIAKPKAINDVVVRVVLTVEG